MGEMRRLVGLKVAMMVCVGLGACGEGPSAAVTTAQQSIRTWSTAYGADTRAERAHCIPWAAVPSRYCDALVAKTGSDEADVERATAALERAERSN